MSEQALTAAAQIHDGAMIALVPVPEDAARLAVPGYEPAHALHLTLCYLGKEDTWTPTQRIALEAALRRLETPRMEGFNWGSSDLGPDEDTGVYMLRGPLFEPLHRQVTAIAREIYGFGFPADRFPTYLPHITAGKGLSSEKLRPAGPIRFDRMRLSFAGTYERDIPLAPSDDRNLLSPLVKPPISRPGVARLSFADLRKEPPAI